MILRSGIPSKDLGHRWAMEHNGPSLHRAMHHSHGGGTFLEDLPEPAY